MFLHECHYLNCFDGTDEALKSRRFERNQIRKSYQMFSEMWSIMNNLNIERSTPPRLTNNCLKITISFRMFFDIGCH